jgi:Integrase core domain
VGYVNSSAVRKCPFAARSYLRTPQVPNPRPRQQIHGGLRRGLPQRRHQSDPHPDPGATGERLAERFVRTVRAECLDWLLILGRRHLEAVLRVYTAHYNRERPHRGLALLTPEAGDAAGLPTATRIDRRDRLCGLIHEYHRAAA